MVPVILASLALPFAADTWRLFSAGACVATLLLLTIALRLYGHEVTFAWRNVLRVLVAFLSVVTYAAVIRAKATPSDFPDRGPDLALVLLVAVSVGLLVAIVGVFESHRH